MSERAASSLNPCGQRSVVVPDRNGTLDGAALNLRRKVAGLADLGRDAGVDVASRPSLPTLVRWAGRRSSADHRGCGGGTGEDGDDVASWGLPRHACPLARPA